MCCALQGGATLLNSPLQWSTKIQRSQSIQVGLSSPAMYHKRAAWITIQRIIQTANGPAAEACRAGCADTLHRFCKKEHDWGWKKFMELNKVLEGFTVSNTLVIKAQVQVIRSVHLQLENVLILSVQPVLLRCRARPTCNADGSP